VCNVNKNLLVQHTDTFLFAANRWFQSAAPWGGPSASPAFVAIVEVMAVVVVVVVAVAAGWWR
jgi:hypothetical protein